MEDDLNLFKMEDNLKAELILELAKLSKILQSKLFQGVSKCYLSDVLHVKPGHSEGRDLQPFLGLETKGTETLRLVLVLLQYLSSTLGPGLIAKYWKS